MAAPSPSGSAPEPALAGAVRLALRGLALVVLVLMVAAVGYSGWIALANWGTIGV